MKISAAVIRQIGRDRHDRGVVCMATVVAGAQERGATQNKTMEEYRFEPPGLMAEPSFIERAAIFGDRHFGNGPITNGLYFDVNNMITGGGWIAAGPGYRHWYKHDSVYVDTSAAMSWRGYKTAQARFELPKLMRSRLLAGHPGAPSGFHAGRVFRRRSEQH